MVPIIEPPDHANFDDRPSRRRRNQACAQGQRKRPGGSGNRCSRKGPNHVQRPMCQVDQTHDTENQRQTGSHQEQHDPRLQPIQHLLDQQQRRHSPRLARSPLSRKPLIFLEDMALRSLKADPLKACNQRRTDHCDPLQPCLRSGW